MPAELDIRPTRLWRKLSEASRITAARAFWEDEAALDQQVQAIDVIARTMKFRPQSVIGLPLEKKARYLAIMPNLPDAIAARALISHHFTAQRPLMAAFLDALGIAHEDGLIKDEAVEAPSSDRLKRAARTIAERFAPEDVALYLATLASQDPDTWGGLREVPEINVPAG